MRFILVNGRTPRSQSFCAMCCEPIEEGYLREIATGLSYCDRGCYLSRSMMKTVRALQIHSSDSRAAPLPTLTLDGMR
jgi:hypothetical protein